MSELGAWLRESREAKELSLAEAAAATHVRPTYLEAIEEGRRKDLPEAVYLRGLVATYGQYLGVDADELRALFAKEYGHVPKVSGRVDSHQPLSEPLRGRRGLLLAAVVIVLILAAAAAVWWYWPDVSQWGESLLSRIREPVARPTATTEVRAGATELITAAVVAEEGSPTASPTDAPVEDLPAASPTSAALPLPTPSPPDTPVPPPPAPTATPTPIPGIWLGVQATGPAWVRITVDGQIAFEGTMDEGDAEVWFGADSVALLTGNAGGTSLTLNGDPLEPLGAPGEVASMTWTWDGESLSSTPGE